MYTFGIGFFIQVTAYNMLFSVLLLSTIPCYGSTTVRLAIHQL